MTKMASNQSFSTDMSSEMDDQLPVSSLSRKLAGMYLEHSSNLLHPSSSADTLGKEEVPQRSLSISSSGGYKPGLESPTTELDRSGSASPLRFRSVTFMPKSERQSQSIPSHVIEENEPITGRARTYTSPLRTRPRSSTKTTSKLEKYFVETNEGETFKVVNEYLVKRFLGRGSYGKVKLAEHVETGEKYAIKVINKSLLKRKRTGRMGNALQDVQKEVAILKRMDHPNVVKLFEVIDDTDHDKMMMVFEFVEGGTISELAVDKIVDEETITPIHKNQPPSPLTRNDQARDIVRQVILALTYVHSLGVVHRDIKPENILCGSDGVIKLSDFGVSTILEGADAQIRKTAGTPAFLAPEVCSGQSFRGSPVDVWALGVTLYSMVCGKVPFNARGLLELYHIIQTESLKFPEETAISDELQDLVGKMLTKNADERITVPEIRTHPWIEGGGAGPLIDLDISMVEVTDAEVQNSVSRIQYLLNSLATIINIKKRMKPIADKARSRSVPPNSIIADAMRAAAKKVSGGAPSPLHESPESSNIDSDVGAIRPNSSSMGTSQVDGGMQSSYAEYDPKPLEQHRSQDRYSLSTSPQEVQTLTITVPASRNSGTASEKGWRIEVDVDDEEKEEDKKEKEEEKREKEKKEEEKKKEEKTVEKKIARKGSPGKTRKSVEKSSSVRAGKEKKVEGRKKSLGKRKSIERKDVKIPLVRKKEGKEEEKEEVKTPKNENSKKKRVKGVKKKLFGIFPKKKSV